MNKISILLLFVSSAAFSESQIQVINLTSIQSHAPQNVVFISKDSKCRYYGNTKKVDSLGGISITRMVCYDTTQSLKTRAYMTEYKIPGASDILIPAGNIWTITNTLI